MSIINREPELCAQLQACEEGSIITPHPPTPQPPPAQPIQQALPQTPTPQDSASCPCLSLFSHPNTARCRPSPLIHLPLPIFASCPSRTAEPCTHRCSTADYCWWAIMSNWKCLTHMQMIHFKYSCLEYLREKKTGKYLFSLLLFSLQQIGLLLEQG